MSATQETSLKYHNLVVSTRGLAEVDGKKIILFVPADEVNQITLKFGRTEHNPILSLILGTILTLVGIWGVVQFIFSPKGFRYELGMIFFGFVGGVILFDSMKKRYFLEIQKPKDICWLIFSKKAALPEIQEFCQNVRAKYNYKIFENV